MTTPAHDPATSPERLFFRAFTQYARHGWRCIPLKGKRPLLKEWPDANLTVEDAKRYWDTDKPSNIGIITGSASQLVVLDFDSGKAFTRWRTAHPEVQTRIVERDGAEPGRCHLYFTLATGDTPPKTQHGDGWDLLSDGAQVCAPPSGHPNGGEYRKTSDRTPPAPWRGEYVPDSPIQTDGDKGGECYGEAERQRYGDSEILRIGDSEAIAVCTPAPPAAVENIITQTQPQEHGERNARILDLARGLKFNCGLAGRPLSELRPLVERWFEMAKSVVKTQSSTENMADFIHAWDRARVPLGDVVGQAWDRARAAPLPAVALQYDHEPVRLLVALCHELARLNPDGGFFLSARAGAKVLGTVEPMTVARWLGLLVADGVLAVTKPGRVHQATRYRWIAGEVAK